MTNQPAVIAIPGRWETKEELAKSVSAGSGGYVLGGQFLYHASKKLGYEAVIAEHDPNLMEAFLYGSRGQLEPEVMDDIHLHTFTVYVKANGSSFDDVLELIEVGASLLNCGGLAIRIETSGLVFTKERWEDLALSQEPFPVYTHFVSMVYDERQYYSVGMKVFNLPDAVLPGTVSPDEASNVLNNFNLHNVMESPFMEEGEIFAFGEGGKRYRLNAFDDTRYDENHIMQNREGLWFLEPLEE